MSFHTTNDSIAHSEEYTDGSYLGTVTANVDPEGLHRIQASVPGLYDTNNGEVPWIGPDKDSPFGFGTGAAGQYGTYGSPAIGSKVRVFLQNGDEHNPMYRPLQVKADVNQQFSSPNVWGYKDPDGNYMIYDMEAHTYTLVTRTGASIEIDATGKRITQVNGDVETSNGDWTLQVMGNISASCSGNADVHADGSGTFQAGGSVAVIAGGVATYHATAHMFTGGPVTSDNSIAAAGDITDLTGSGNARTMGNMRVVYDTHDHDVPNVEGGNSTAKTTVPNEQI